MARGRGPKRGGAAGRGGRGGGAAGRGGKKGSAATAAAIHVAKPGVHDLPESLTLVPQSTGVPEPITSALSDFRNFQTFFSALERLQPELSGASGAGPIACWMGARTESFVGVSRDSASPFNATVLFADGDVRPVFLKRTHILDPMRAMEGDYAWPAEGSLPAPREPWRTALSKLTDPMNEAYVDALFALYASKMVEGGLSPHWCRCYGTFAARVERYLYNISEEYESLRRKPWWKRNQKAGLFRQFDPLEETEDDDVHAARRAAFTSGGEDLLGDDFEELEEGEIGEAAAATSEQEDAEVEADADTTPVALQTPRIQLKAISKSGVGGSNDEDDENSDEGSDETDDSEEAEMFAEFKDFPVQVTMLEKAEGTMDELLDDEMDPEKHELAATKEARWTAWLFQVCAALTAAQHWFGFVHNDLHTNNVMWCSTAETHVYYRIHRGSAVSYMRVPTYGRIIKIIDFGRASFHLPDPAGFFISDAFYPGNDAGEQYNCEPFYDAADGPRVEPNRSFDLSRLAVSLLESLYPERPVAASPTRIMSREGAKIHTETVSGVYNLIWEWLLDDEGKNILRLPSGEERYPDFDLYKAIAAHVHKAVPAKQIEKAVFSGFSCLARDVPSGSAVYDLWI